MATFQDQKSRKWSIANDDQPPKQTKEIQRDFSRFDVTFEPKVQITQSKNLVKDIIVLRSIMLF